MQNTEYEITLLGLYQLNLEDHEEMEEIRRQSYQKATPRDLLRIVDLTTAIRRRMPKIALKEGLNDLPF